MELSKTADAIFKNLIMVITAVQVVLALIWIVVNAVAGKTTVFGIVYFVSFLIISAVFLISGKRTVGIIIAYLISMPLILHGLTSDNHVFGMPEAPAGSAKQLVVQRLAWPELRGMNELYSVSGWADGLLFEATCDSRALWTKLFPEIESHMGREELNRISNNAISDAVAFNKRGIVKGLITEGVGYAFTPISVLCNLCGTDGSRSGIYYSDFTSLLPQLFGFYFKFGCIAWIIIMLSGIFSFAVSRKKEKLGKYILIMALLIAYNLFFPVRGVDYKNSTYIIALWLFIFSGSVRRNNDYC
ncbi:MAG: hypothetical protein MJ107_00585 [Lachnospiraceae bacterium]|nr:hypothetical protein [Lachnospiraceae bacterium]